MIAVATSILQRKKALQIAGFINIAQKLETTDWVDRSISSSLQMAFRCGCFFVTSCFRVHTQGGIHIQPRLFIGEQERRRPSRRRSDHARH
jgi:hypothetical protein